MRTVILPGDKVEFKSINPDTGIIGKFEGIAHAIYIDKIEVAYQNNKKAEPILLDCEIKDCSRLIPIEEVSKEFQAEWLQAKSKLDYLQYKLDTLEVDLNSQDNVLEAGVRVVTSELIGLIPSMPETLIPAVSDIVVRLVRLIEK